VKARLENKIGIQAHILQAEGDISAAPATRFETAAREARYKALGRACAAHNLPYLLMGHHSDDAYETALFRLSGRARFKLSMEEGPGDIPECTGLHGVHRSGEPVRVRFGGGDMVGFESGGVKVVRPLLAFDKTDLMGVCERAGLEWVEDPSNRLVTLTFRNAIRGRLTPDVLPEALKKESVLAMVGRAQAEFERHRDAANRLFDKAALNYDPYLGRLAVTLPSQDAIQRAMRTLPASGKPLVLTMFTRRLAELISPTERIQLSHAAAVADTMFALGDDKRGGAALASSCPSIGSTVFRRSAKRASRLARTPDGTVWTLRRQPISKGEAKVAYREKGPLAERWIFDVPAAAAVQQQPGESSAPPTETTAGAPRLWDNRLWLAVTNRAPHALRVEPLSNALLNALGEQMRRRRLAVKFTPRRRHALLSKKLTSLRALSPVVGGVQPGSPPEFLPVITYLDPNDGERKILAFPSLELRVVQGEKGGEDVPEWAAGVDWTVRFRKVDCEEARLKRMMAAGRELEEFRGLEKAAWPPSDLKLRFEPAGVRRERVRPAKMFDRPARPLDKDAPLVIRKVNT
jgi:tRNA(Ile)-lysidine synthase TilS/MesJ